MVVVMPASSGKKSKSTQPKKRISTSNTVNGPNKFVKGAKEWTEWNLFCIKNKLNKSRKQDGWQSISDFTSERLAKKIVHAEVPNQTTTIQIKIQIKEQVTATCPILTTKYSQHDTITETRHCTAVRDTPPLLLWLWLRPVYQPASNPDHTPQTNPETTYSKYTY